MGRVIMECLFWFFFLFLVVILFKLKYCMVFMVGEGLKINVIIYLM